MAMSVHDVAQTISHGKQSEAIFIVKAVTVQHQLQQEPCLSEASFH